MAIVAILAVAAILVVVHELGHYVAGLLIGIPRRSMRIELGFPVSQVALRDDAGNRSHPGRDWDLYLALFRRLARTSRGAFAFVAGGMVLQTVAAVGTAAILASLSFPQRSTARVVWVSLRLLVSYLVLDGLLTRRGRRPAGDASVLWTLSPQGTLVLVAALLAIHAAALAGLR